MGAKGILQSAWFRASGIPADQRSIRTLAKVGGLVGKVVEIDEGTRYRYDYVRLRIACRNVSKVPKIAEGTLGMYIIDFGFEREIMEEGNERMLRSGIEVTADSQPPQKKSKADTVYVKSTQNNNVNDEVNKRADDGKSGKQVQVASWSAPLKIDFKRKSQTRLMGDA